MLFCFAPGGGGALVLIVSSFLNSNLSQLPQKIIYGTELCNIDSAGVVRIPVEGMSSGITSLTIKSSNLQIVNSGYDPNNKYIFAGLRSDLGASIPTSGSVWVDYIMVGR